MHIFDFILQGLWSKLIYEYKIFQTLYNVYKRITCETISSTCCSDLAYIGDGKVLFYFGDTFEFVGHNINFKHGSTTARNVLYDNLDRVGKISLQHLFDRVTGDVAIVIVLRLWHISIAEQYLLQRFRCVCWYGLIETNYSQQLYYKETVHKEQSNKTFKKLNFVSIIYKNLWKPKRIITYKLLFRFCTYEFVCMCVCVYVCEWVYVQLPEYRILLAISSSIILV